jgi:hypothetical protein
MDGFKPAGRSLGDITGDGVSYVADRGSPRDRFCSTFKVTSSCWWPMTAGFTQRKSPIDRRLLDTFTRNVNSVIKSISAGDKHRCDTDRMRRKAGHCQRYCARPIWRATHASAVAGARSAPYRRTLLRVFAVTHLSRFTAESFLGPSVSR